VPLNLDFSLPKKKKESEQINKTSKKKIDSAEYKANQAVKKRKFRSDLSSLESLRETLFEPAFKKEEDVTISFKVFTKEMVRISDNGQFGIKYNEVDKTVTLYHYKKPIVFDYNLEMEHIFTNKEDISIYENLCIKDAENIMISIVREEYALKKVQQLSKIDESLKKAQDEKRKLEEELEKVDEDFLIAQELENVYLVPNPLMEDLFGKGMEEVIEVLDEDYLNNESCGFGDIYFVPNDLMEDLLEKEAKKLSPYEIEEKEIMKYYEKEEIKDEQTNNPTQSNDQKSPTGGMFAYLPKKSS
jgi:hypothetical protein